MTAAPAGDFNEAGGPDERTFVPHPRLEERDEEMMHMMVDPRYDPLRSHGKFQEILAALDLQ